MFVIFDIISTYRSLLYLNHLRVELSLIYFSAKNVLIDLQVLTFYEYLQSFVM